MARGIERRTNMENAKEETINMQLIGSESPYKYVCFYLRYSLPKISELDSNENRCDRIRIVQDGNTFHALRRSYFSFIYLFI